MPNNLAKLAYETYTKETIRESNSFWQWEAITPTERLAWNAVVDVIGGAFRQTHTPTIRRDNRDPWEGQLQFKKGVQGVEFVDREEPVHGAA